MHIHDTSIICQEAYSNKVSSTPQKGGFKLLHRRPTMQAYARFLVNHTMGSYLHDKPYLPLEAFVELLPVECD